MKRNKMIGLLCVIFMLYIISCTGKDENENDTPMVQDINENINSEKSMETGTKSSASVDIYDEEEFKLKCNEIIFKDLSEAFIGEYVTKEIIIGSSTTTEDGIKIYECGATEDFLEEMDFYQKTYNVYRIKDYRIDNAFPIQGSDVMRIYGVIEDVSKSYHTADYNPTIKVYYADYVRQYGEKPEDAKSAEEIKEQREKEAEEKEYKQSLNSDYTGATKNIENMNELPLEEYITYCDKMNYRDITSDEDLTGRHIAIHIQLFDELVFKSEQGKEKQLGSWIDISKVQDCVWDFLFYGELAEDYISDFGRMYFQNVENINPADLKKGTNLYIYGQVIEMPAEYYDKMKILVRYYEVE